MAGNGYRQLMSDMRSDQTQATSSPAVMEPSTSSMSSQIRDSAAEGMFSARDDIRHKLVEEGWYGKQTTGDVELPQADPDQGNVWGNGEGNAWNEGGSVWSNENNAGVWGHENEPERNNDGIDNPKLEEPDLEQ